MVGLRLLDAARAAGLTVTAQGDRLVIRGPRKADAMAQRLLARKAAVMAALARAEVNPQKPTPLDLTALSVDFVPEWEECPEVPEPCPTCQSFLRWWNLLGEVRCLSCEPPIAGWTLLRLVEKIRQHDAGQRGTDR